MKGAGLTRELLAVPLARDAFLSLALGGLLLFPGPGSHAQTFKVPVVGSMETTPVIVGEAIYFATGKDFYRLDIATRKITKLFTGNQKITVDPVAQPGAHQVHAGAPGARIAVCSGKTLYIYETASQTKRTFTADHHINWKPALNDDGSYIRFIAGDVFYRLGTSDMRLLRKYNTGLKSYGNVDEQYKATSFRVIKASGEIASFSIKRDGSHSIRWIHQHNARVLETVIEHQYNYVYFCNPKGILVCLNYATGKEKWRVKTKGRIGASPVLSGDGILLGDQRGNVYTVNSSGEIVSEVQVDGSVTQVAAGPKLNFAVVNFDTLVFLDDTEAVGEIVGKYATDHSITTGLAPYPAGDSSAVAFGTGNQLWSVELSDLPIFFRQLEGGYFEVSPGSSHTLNVEAFGTNLSYRWYFNGQPLAEVANSDTLTIPKPGKTSSGRYKVVVSSGSGSVESEEVVLSFAPRGMPRIRVNGKLAVDDFTQRGKATVRIGTTFGEGTIFYTLDGSEPGFTSLLYEGPIQVASTATVRAMAYSSDFSQSAMSDSLVLTIVPEYTIELDVTDDGNVEILPNTATYLAGEVVTIKARPNEGWRFVRWEGDLEGSETERTLTISGHHSVKAVFEKIPRYMLAVKVQGNGTVKRSLRGRVYEGTAITLEPIPSHGWRFKKWEGGASGGDEVEITVTMDKNKVVTAVFEPIPRYHLEIKIEGQGSVRTSRSEVKYYEGTKVKLWAISSEGWRFVRWEREGDLDVPVSSVSVVMDIDKEVTAVFEPIPIYKLKLFVEGEGGFQVRVGSDTKTSNGFFKEKYYESTVVEVVVQPAEGWRFKNWDDHTEKERTVTMDNHITMTAWFEPIPKYTLTVKSGGGGGFKIGTSSPTTSHEQQYYEGTEVPVKAGASGRWEFIGWEGDVESAEKRLILKLDRDLEVRAVFGTAIQPVVQGNGRVDIWPQRASHPYGSKVQLVAVADEGHVFGRWGQALKVTSSVLEVEVTQVDPRVIALFAPLREGQLSLSVLLNGNGQVTLDPPRNLFKAGDQVTLTAKPLGQEVFSGWSGDAEGKGTRMVLTMDQSKTVTANFQQGRTPSITWEKPTDIVYGTALGPLQFIAEAEVPGTLKYSPSSDTILPAGKRQPLRVQFTPIDSATYSSTSVTVFLNVLKAPLQIVAEDKIRSLNQNNPPFSYKATGFVNGENAGLLKFAVTFQCSAVRSSPIAKYLITPRGAVADNYDITYVAGTLTIVRNVKDLVTLQIERKSKTLVNLIAKGTRGEMVVFESSTDLKRWQEIGTMPMTNGKAILSVPLTAPVQVFRGKR